MLSPEGERLAANFSTLGPIAAGVDQEEAGIYLAHRIFYHYLGDDEGNISYHNVDNAVEVIYDLHYSFAF